MGITKAVIFRISVKTRADELMQQTGKLLCICRYTRQVPKSCSDWPKNILFFVF